MATVLRKLAAFALMITATSTSFAQRDLKDIPPPDPELERESFIVADGFEVNLFASDPKLAKPIQMNFDPQGRLWVASSSVYPHIKPGQEANDTVLVLEDSDGDGTADKTHVFADGLLIPTGVAPGDGGVYVANSTELLHLKDTDGDGKADLKRIMLSGFGTEDTHHILHTLRWGPGGMLYMNQSIYIHSHIETPFGVRRLNAGGIWQFRPETMRLEVYARGFYNPWGHHFDRFGQSFATDGAHGEGINYILSGAYYASAYGATRILHGLNPGSPKHCGLEIVSGRHLPDDWQGNMLTNDFRGHRVCRFVVTESGSGYASREAEELIKTKHVAFRPIDVKMGPDGAIYIADWYNPIIQHGEVDFRDPRRDHTHGRIWRVTYKGRPVVERPKLIGASTDELLDQLKSPEGWTRENAKRVLKERGADEVVAPLKTWVSSLDPNDADVEHHRLEALWVYQSLNIVEPELLRELLNASDGRVRAAAVRVLSHWQTQIPDSLELLSRAARDEFPRVRLEAARALAGRKTADALAVALQALDQPVDDLMEYGLWLTTRELSPYWLPEAERGNLKIVGDLSKLTFALKAIGSASAVPVLRKVLDVKELSAEGQDGAIELLATMGDVNDLRRVLDVVVSESTKPERQLLLLRHLAEAGERRKLKPTGDLSRLKGLLAVDNASLKRAVLQCVGLWKVDSLEDQLVAMAKSSDTEMDVRKQAIASLAQFGGASSRQALVDLAGTNHSMPTRLLAVESLASSDVESAAQRVSALLAEPLEEGQARDLFAAFITKKAGPQALSAALAETKLTSDVATIGLRVIENSGQKHEGLAATLQRIGGVKKGPVQLSPEELKSLVAEVNEKGEAARGENVFRRDNLNCMKCHAIAGAGGRVGPDLISLGASAQVDYLIESLLDPNKKVKENYHTLVVTTLEGKVVSGVKVRQSDSELVLRDANDVEVSIPVDDIDEQAVGASMMPAGLTEKITHSELVDLVRFLSELGKLGKFAVDKSPVVRRWQVLIPNQESYYRLRRTRHSSTTEDDPAYSWRPAYSTVGGILPLADLPDFRYRSDVEAGRRGTAFVRFELRANSTGTCRLVINSPAGLTLWLNTVPIEVAPEAELELTEGTHRVTLAVNLEERQQPLRIEVVPGGDSPADVQIVSGK